MKLELDVRSEFVEFYKTFRGEKGGFKYRDKISELPLTGATSLVVDFDDLLSFNSDLAAQLIDAPRSVIDAASRAILDVMRVESPAYAERVKQFQARFRKLPELTSIRKIRSHLFNRLVAVEGILTRATGVKHRLTEAVFRCRRCDERIRVPQTERYLVTPTQCTNPECGSKPGPFDLVLEESSFIDWQRLTIQEKPEELPPGQLPRSIEAIASGDLVDAVRPGDRVVAVGILEFIHESTPRGKLTSFSSFLDLNFIEVSEKGVEEVEITPEDETKIREAAKDPSIVEKVVRSIAPSIYGMDEVKEAIAYLLFGGEPKVLPDGMRIRGDVHVLLVGDPGTAKSQLLQYVARLAPRGIYTSGKGSTAAGLTATVVRDKAVGDFYLEAGALVLADGGVAAIDEIDKMRAEDRIAIHEAMEQQTVSIAKAGIVATLNARTSILAAANPAYGRYAPQRPVAENINLPVTILSRFDFIFILTDKPDPTKDAEKADYVLKLRSSPTPVLSVPFSPDFLRKHIAYARRHVHPKLSSEAMEKIKSFFLELRAKGEPPDAPVPITLRQLESLVRAAEARARIALRDIATVEDAEAAIRLLQAMLRQVGYDRVSKSIDIDLIMVGKPKSQQERFIKLVDVITELEREASGMPVSKEAILKRAEEEGLEGEFVEKALRQLIKEGTLYSPRDGYYKRA
ncbi:MAG: minichromosome maintenance protein MCM [Candidatus Nezhaarchaeota archaeon]|nr:minichromosome maintenance protein MCM [Candidatus Nezhaarchaeota archaeon]